MESDGSTVENSIVKSNNNYYYYRCISKSFIVCW